MGLDNGIQIKRNELTKRIGLDERFKDEYCTDLEVCYWRKCWGLRDEIIHKLGGENDDCEYILTLKDVKNILSIVEYFFDKDRWNNEGQSIWTWKEMRDHLAGDMKNLSYLIAKMEDYPDGFEVTFYDSY